MQEAGGHIFNGHLLQPKSPGALPSPVTERHWPSVILCVCLALLVMVKARWFNKLVRILQSTFSAQTLQQLEREETNVFRFYSVALNAILLLNLAFICWKLNELYGLVLQDTPSLLQYLFFLSVISGVFAGKFVLNRLIGIVTGQSRFMAEYAVNSGVVNQGMGVVIFPFVVMLEFSPFNPAIFLWSGLAVLLLGLLLKWYRGSVKGVVGSGIGFLQIFSYFCALEILPVLVLVKYLVKTFNKA